MNGVTTKWDTKKEMLEELKEAYKKIHDLRSQVSFWERQYDRVDLRNDNLECANAWLTAWAILSIILLIALFLTRCGCQ